MRNLLLLTVFLFACSDGSSIPEDVMAPDKMGAVLYDVVRADETVDFLKLKDSIFQRFDKRTALYDTVFVLHGITKTVFKKSLDYYEGRPDLLKELLDDLQKKITDTIGKTQTRKENRVNNTHTPHEK